MQAAGGSVLRVLGTACGLGVEGSGWVAAPGLVVTNAHVVAGEDDTTVSTSDGASFDATAVHYDPDNDLAHPAHRGATCRRCRVAESASRGQSGAVLGYPDNGPFDVAPARFGETARRDQRGLLRARADPPLDQLACAARVRSGNSGGPIVDAQGRVLGTVFATTTYGNPGGFAIPDETVQAALGQVGDEVDTGPCTG